MAVISMRQMLEAGVHFGHQTRRWNPKMRRFIFGERNGIYIVDLHQTLDRIDARENRLWIRLQGFEISLAPDEAESVIVTPMIKGKARIVCARIIACGVKSQPNSPSIPSRESSKNTTRPTTTGGKPMPV